MVNKRTAKVAFKTESGLEHSNGREKKDVQVKVEDEDESDEQSEEGCDGDGSTTHRQSMQC